MNTRDQIGTDLRFRFTDFPPETRAEEDVVFYVSIFLSALTQIQEQRDDLHLNITHDENAGTFLSFHTLDRKSIKETVAGGES